MSYSRRILLLTLTVSCLALSALALAAPAPPPIVAHFDNGLTAIVQEDHSAPVAAVRFYVGAGSVYEGKYLGAGITHYLEHTIMDGTVTRSHDQIRSVFEAMGNNANAYTSTDHTCYYATVPSRDVETAIDLISDFTFNATFPQKEVDTQRGIIQQEMAIGDDDMERRVYFAFAETAFHVHPQRYRVIGYPPMFNKLTRQDLVDYHSAYYVPDNVTAVVVGDFAAQDALALLHKYLDKYPRGSLDKPVLPAEPPQIGPRRRIIEDKTASRAYCMLGFRSIDLYHPDLYALDTLAYLLSNGDTSRLVQDLREKRGLVDSIDAGSETPTYDAGTFYVSFTCDPAKVHEAEKAILDHLARLQTEPVGLAELERAKRQKAAENVFARETIEGSATALGDDYISTGDVNFSDLYVEAISKVTPGDIQRVARTYFRFDRPIFVCIKPPAAAAPQVVHQQTQEIVTVRRVLPNGMTLLVTEDHRLPSVHIICAGPGGVRYETSADNGICRMMNEMLLRGTTTRTREQIATALESRGGEFGAFSGWDSAGLSATALSADFVTALEVLADCMTNPTFSPDEIARQKELTLAAIKAQSDDVDTVGERLLLPALFPTHPYRLDSLGTDASIKAITREALIAFHQRLARAGSLVLAVVGDVRADQVEALATRAFAGMPKGRVSPVQLQPEAPPAAVREVVEKREQQQAITNIGFIGPQRTSADRYALDIMSAAFAGLGYPAGRLHEDLRGNALVYATFGYATRGLDPGYFDIYAGTAPEKAGEVRQRIIALVKGIQNAPISADELARAKSIALANHDINLQNPAARARTEALDELYGLGYDNYRKYAAEISKITVDDVQRMARKYMDLDHCVIAVTTPGEGNAER